MRHILITTILISSIFYTLSTSAQSWMTDSLKWKETREQNFGDILTTSFVVWTTESINDTIYRRIHQTQCSDAPVADIFICHIRAEGNEVFARVDNVEYLLYDFDLEVGDTYTPSICIYANEVQILDGNTGTFEVINVSNIMIAGEERRVISFNSTAGAPQDLQWIEGVGSNKGLFHGVEVCGVIDVISRLTCFERNTENEYMSPEFETCCVFALSDGDDLNRSANGQILYPNPISSSKVLKLSEGIETGLLVVLSQEGKQVYKEDISKNSNLTPSEMGLSPGLYHFQLEMENKRLHQKIVVY